MRHKTLSTSRETEWGEEGQGVVCRNQSREKRNTSDEQKEKKKGCPIR